MHPPIHIPAEFPVLSTSRIDLKPIGKEHVEDLFEMRSDPEVMQYILRPLARTHDDAMKFIDIIIQAFDKREAITWGIFEKGQNKLMGTVGFWRIDAENRRGEIGYLLHKNLWRQGIMEEVLKTVIPYGFDAINLHAIEGYCNPGNEASMGLLEKMGFSKEAQFTDGMYFEGQFHDSVVFCLLNR